MPLDGDWDWLRREVRTAAAGFAEQLRAVSDTSDKVPNLEWSIADLGAHLSSLPRLYREQDRLGASFEAPTDWSAFSVEARSHVTTTDAEELAVHLIEEAETLLAPDDPNELRMLYGRETNVFNTAAGMLTECILHGQDLGRLTGHKPVLTKRHALAGLEQQMALTPVFVDPVKAAKLAGTYGLRFRDGPDFTYRIDRDGQFVIDRAWPDQADARLNADPAAFLAAGLGRINPLVAGLTGKIVAYGRKPWRMAQLGNIVVDGV